PPSQVVKLRQFANGPSIMRKEKRHSSSTFHISDNRELVKLPLLKDCPAPEREALFVQKVQQCCVIFDFAVDPLSDLKYKEVKRATLNELVDFVTHNKGIITEPIYMEAIRMFSLNTFRALPPPSNPNGAEFDPEEDEPNLEASWPHLQLTVQYDLQTIQYKCLYYRITKCDRSNICTLLTVRYDSQTIYQRDFEGFSKNVLIIHVRPTLGLEFMMCSCYNYSISPRFIYETERHNGVAELLEILGSIINGFALPLKEEHKVFLMKVLMPLHKTKSLGMYHPQ
ncbi:predicted protein, partial [Nematostella vectensis]